MHWGVAECKHDRYQTGCRGSRHLASGKWVARRHQHSGMQCRRFCHLKAANANRNLLCDHIYVLPHRLTYTGPWDKESLLQQMPKNILYNRSKDCRKECYELRNIVTRRMQKMRSRICVPVSSASILQCIQCSE